MWFLSFLLVFTHLMDLSVLIIVMMDGLNTSTNGTSLAYGCILMLGPASNEPTEHMIDDFKGGLM